MGMIEQYKPPTVSSHYEIPIISIVFEHFSISFPCGVKPSTHSGTKNFSIVIFKKVAKSLNVEVGINVEGGIFWIKN